LKWSYRILPGTGRGTAPLRIPSTEVLQDLEGVTLGIIARWEAVGPSTSLRLALLPVPGGFFVLNSLLIANRGEIACLNAPVPKRARFGIFRA
jgi:hypothetical protein